MDHVSNAEIARVALVNAIESQDSALILQKLAAYADLVQKVGLQIKARELLTGLQNNGTLHHVLLEELRLLASRRNSEVATPRVANSPTLIGIAGQANMGKDTLAIMLMELWPSLKRRAFGDAVKQLACETFGVQMETVEEWKRREDVHPDFDVPMRQVLQTIGDGFRTIRSSVWVDRAMKEAPNGIYSDVRYENEAAAIRQRGGIVVLIGRREALNADPNPSEATLRPLIEWLLDNASATVTCARDLPTGAPGAINFDIFVRNDGTLAELRDCVQDSLKTKIADWS